MSINGELFGPAATGEGSQEAPASAHAPLAARFRPRHLSEYVGQAALLGPGKPLRRLIESDRLTSVIFFGPPGVGKTSLAEVIARGTACRFERLNAVEASVADLRRILSAAQMRQSRGGERTLLFIDEIHRFNKAQQDVLLPDVESGVVRLIGATTHNPSFYINGPLVSRSQIFALEPLGEDDLGALIDAALADEERGLGAWKASLTDEARRHLIAVSEGDARRALNGLELAVLTTKAPPGAPLVIQLRDIEECVQKKRVLYDRDEDQHYDTISAFIKSVRGSAPDAAIYWLAKMIEAGEDPRFIARRLIVLASEDIGLADPRGLLMAVAAKEAVEFIGMPEARITLAQATLYLATAPKSNSAILAIDAALEAVRKERHVPVPKPLRDAHSSSARSLGHGQGYLYSHDFPGHIAPQDYGVPEGRYYQPAGYGHEKIVRERLAAWAQLRKGPKAKAEDRQA